MENHRLNTIVMVCVAYVAAQIFADITSLRIVLFAGFSMDAGTLVYPFTFTLRDVVHKTAGVYVTRRLILAAAVINLLMAGLFSLVASMQPDLSVGEQLEFGLVLAPVWRIVIASIIAEVTAEWIDTEVYQLWIRRVGYNKQWGRVFASNAVSVPLDSLLFVLIAFAGVMPWAVVGSIFVANVVVKGVVSVVSIPGIYMVKDQNELTNTTS
jgi:uncharacterized integral membrane protein (TIGR00697 family)